MKRTKLKQLITEVINEIVSEDNIGNFRQHVLKRLAKLPKYKHNPTALQSAADKIVSLAREGNQRVCEMWMAWESEAMNETGAVRARQDYSNDPSFIARIDNNVFPHGEDELEKMAEEHQVRVRYLGDAQFGTENLAAYRVKLSAKSQGQLDAFVDMLAEENGIEFYETPELAKKLEEGMETSALKWSDGLVVPIDAAGNPVGYVNLGYANSGVEIPKSEDWRRFYNDASGLEKFLSTKLRKWYSVDSSG